MVILSNLEYHNSILIKDNISSLNRCPLLYFIPTHRVICSNGKVGSFCAKPSIKEDLIKMEKKYAIIDETKKEESNLTENDFCMCIGDLLVK